MRWKQNKWRIIVATSVLVLLGFAFWYGGDSKGLHGWQVNKIDDVVENADLTTIVESPSTPVSPPEEDTVQESGFLEPPAEDIPAEEPPSPVKTEEAEKKFCTISISCATILENMDFLEPTKTPLVPENGWILGSTQVEFTEGETVFDVLLRVCKDHKIHLEFSETPMYQSAYIEGINNLYEFDCGELSGWMYSVNSWFPNYGCSQYTLSDGDRICWVFTCDLGNDVGGGYSVG